MTKNPLVSVCIPTFNGGNYIAAAMESAITQSYTNLEIIISDDDSKDNTIEIIESYKSKTKIPIHINNHIPCGIGANWNYSVEKANGDYIKFLFQDDLLMPTCIEEMVKLIESDTKIGLVYSLRNILYNPSSAFHKDFINTYKYLHKSWAKIEVTHLSIINGTKLLKDENLLRLPENKIGEPTAVLLKKECFDKVGYFDAEMKQALDIEYWYRVMAHYKVGFIDKELISFRLHDEQASYVNAENSVSEVTLVLSKFYEKIFWKLNNKDKLKLFLMFSNVSKLTKRIYNKLKKAL